MLALERKPKIIPSNIGKEYLFYIAVFPDDKIFTFSSSICEIGITHDCELKNNTKVLVLSGSIAAYHPIFGELKVTRVMSDKVFWVNSWDLYPIK